MSNAAEPAPNWPVDDEIATEELARRQGVGPIRSVADLARPDSWESDEEWTDFIEDLHASRHADVS
jgi:hypothetical protein